MLTRRFRKGILTLIGTMIALTAQASAFVLTAHRPAYIAVAVGEEPVVTTALSLLAADFQRVLDAQLLAAQPMADETQIIAGTVNGPMQDMLAVSGVDLTPLKDRKQAFLMAQAPDGRLIVVGSDAAGTAYGLIELSRRLGVSPWEWWADVEPARLDELRLPDGFRTLQAPDVEFRGVLPSVPPAMTQRLFELMLRLRANLCWLPTADAAKSYFQSQECQALAAQYGVLCANGVAQPLPADMPQPLICEDDGFGYIRHFPTQKESERSAGNGVFYHIAYDGAPHSYLWLGTANPYLLFQQMSEAYYHGANRLWVLAIDDIKTLEYQMQLFMDIAWDIEAVRRHTVGMHMEDFYVTNIGRDIARLTAIYMKDHYHLSFQRKPEHLAATRVGEATSDWSTVHDLPWSEKRIRARLTRYDKLQRNILWIADSVRRTHPDRYDAFYELVEYPILAATAMNEKYLTAQLARHGKAYLSRDNVATTWQRSDAAHQRVQELTRRYNALRGGKWQGIMDACLSNQTVFQPVPHVKDVVPMPSDEPYIATFYGASYSNSSFTGSDILDPVLGLGASIRAMPIPKGCNVSYQFTHDFGAATHVAIELHMLPTHPIEEEQRVTVSIDGSEPLALTYATQEESEEWKQNVLQGFTALTVRLPLSRTAGPHTLTIGALDDGVVLDELFVRKAQQPSYEH